MVRLRAAVASGASLLAAFGVLARSDGPWAAAADGVVRRAGAGMSIADALEGWSTGSSGRALVADALAIAGATGASQAAALDAAARTLAERRSLDREVRALASQAVASAVLVVAAPLAFAVLVAVADARVRHLYTSTVVGPLCALLGLVLDALGAWWMAVLVRRVR